MIKSMRYANGTYNRASGTRNAFGALSADLEAEGHPPITVISGDREYQDQVDIFLSKFHPQATGDGPYGDVRWWQGVRYVRYVGGGTVAPPGGSNHEKRRANDLAWPYNTDTVAHRRAQVLAKRHGITCEGMGFREWWHWTFWGDLGTISTPTGAGTSNTPTPAPTPVEESEEDDMAAMKGATYTRKSDGATVCILFNDASGFYVEHTGVPASYNNTIAADWGTGSWAPITESHATVLKRALDATRRTTVAGSLSVDITDA